MKGVGWEEDEDVICMYNIACCFWVMFETKVN